jgi:hypothetical protein
VGQCAHIGAAVLNLPGQSLAHAKACALQVVVAKACALQVVVTKACALLCTLNFR